MNKRLEKLIGGTIHGIVVDADGAPCLDIRLPDGRHVYAWVMRDPEGNGPGWLHIQDETPK